MCSSDIDKTIKYKNGFKTAQTIWLSEGMRGFFKGLGPKTITQSLSTAISWTAYETFKTVLIGEKAFGRH